MGLKRSVPRPGCLSPIALLAALLVALAAGGVIAASGGQIFTPGPLNAQAAAQPVGGVLSHAQISDCTACHPAPWSGQSMASACVACHPEVQADPHNFHAALFTRGQSRCTACHSDHHGAQASLTSMDLQTFDHTIVGYSLAAHQNLPGGATVACADCHPNGYKSYDDSVCVACHTRLKADFMQPHLAAFGAACRACHDGLDSWGHTFDHTRTLFAITGKHSSVTCAQCHPAARTVADLKSAPQTCSACHAKSDPHAGRLGADCSACHTTQGWQNANLSDHGLTGFTLVGKHISVKCDACHTNGVFAGTPTDCIFCHRDVHENDLGQDCSKCHTPVDWKQATVDHSTTAFPLTGKHLAAKCEDCHINSVWKGTPTACYGCHQKDDAHKGQYGQDCSVCHATTGWLPANFNHALTAFPLTGAHTNLACNRCHTSGPNGVTFKGLAAVCSACHGDPAYHAGLFGLDCKSCHTTTAWLPAQFNLPHGFDLHHGGAGSCRDCHPNNLNTHTCTKCHPGGAPSDNGGGGN